MLQRKAIAFARGIADARADSSLLSADTTAAESATQFGIEDAFEKCVPLLFVP